MCCCKSSALLIQFTQKIAGKKLPTSPSVDELMNTQTVVRLTLQKILGKQYSEDHGYSCLDPSIFFDNDEKLLQFLYEEIHLREQ